MAASDDKSLTQRIRDAVFAKRDRPKRLAPVSAEQEARLVDDIQQFDLEAAERRARAEYSPHVATTRRDADLQFPGIFVDGVERSVSSTTPHSSANKPVATEAPVGGGLLERLRQQAEQAQGDAKREQISLTQLNTRIDQALFQAFHYLHDLVQQLNVIKPPIKRRYRIADEDYLDQLNWAEGFADYRRQPQSEGALVERVTFSYGLVGKQPILIERDDLGRARMHNFLFDAGLQFETQEFKNVQRYVERVRFMVTPKVSVTTRWQADFQAGRILLDIRNLDRLGAMRYSLSPLKLDLPLLEAFGQLILGEPSDFFERLR